ncbi:unnamed protein product [Paramecium sonneborni]|uniref:Uncharacterized protein n=1 Tax=Paramecium sonneborni TaxID=65129 RepID=A0A8S1NXS6_9CILI|nr:unnamed protein product [Paramecium sonneborni]
MGSSFNCISTNQTESIQDVMHSQRKNDHPKCLQHNCDNRDQNVVMNYIKPISKDDDKCFFQIMKNYQIIEQAQIHTKYNRKFYLEKFTNTTKQYKQKKNHCKHIYQHSQLYKYTKSTQFKSDSTKRRSFSEESQPKSILLQHHNVQRTSFSHFCKSVHFEDEKYFPPFDNKINHIIF